MEVLFLELKQLRYFLQICEDESFSTAAQKLFITQQGLSMSLARLEEELSCKLFTRTTKKLMLTADGEYLKDVAQKILALADGCTEHFSAQKALHIASAIDPIGVFPHSVRKALQGQDSQFPIVLHMGSAFSSEALLDESICNFGFVCGPIDSEKYESVFLMQREYRYLVNKQHPLAQNSTLRIEDLNGNPLILPGKKSKIYHEMKNLCAEKGVVMNVAFETNSQILIHHIVKDENNSIGQVLDYYTENIHDPEIKVLTLAGTELRWKLYLLWKKDHRLSRQEQAFIRFVSDAFLSSNNQNNPPQLQ